MNESAATFLLTLIGIVMTGWVLVLIYALVRMASACDPDKNMPLNMDEPAIYTESRRT